MYQVDIWETTNRTAKHTVEVNGATLKTSFVNLKRSTTYELNIVAINVDSHGLPLTSMAATCSFRTGTAYPVA